MCLKSGEWPAAMKRLLEPFEWSWAHRFQVRLFSLRNRDVAAGYLALHHVVVVAARVG